MQLYYQDQLRSETDSDVISNLTRKGWTECPAQPSYDGATQNIAWDTANHDWVVTDKGADEIAADRRAQFPDCSPRQMRTWMVTQNIDLDSIPGVIDQIITDPVQNKIAKVAWEFSIAIERDNSFTVAIGNALGYTTAQMDAAWADILAL
jgi:hypothetical protein